MVSVDPRKALLLAEGLLERGDLDAESRAVAERAAALAELDLGLVGESRARFERAKSQAAADGVVHRLPELQIGLAMALLQGEEPEAAMAELDAALAGAGDLETRGRAESQRATILMRLGRHREGLDEAARAIVTCRAAGSEASVARLLSNVGVVRAYLGEYTAAEEALREALVLLRAQGADLAAANVVHNLGFVAGMRGDVPAALSFFQEAFDERLRLDVPADIALVDRCQVLLSARLLPEARSAAAAAVAGLERSGLAADLAEARLVLAEVALAEGDVAEAAQAARLAAEALRRQERPNWATLAEFVEVRARWAGGATAASIPEAVELAARLTAAGWRLQGLEVLVLAARGALAAGEAAQVCSLFTDVDLDDRSGGDVSSDERVRLAYARGLVRLASGERRPCLAELREGLRIAEEHRAAFGATELRARATVAAADLAELGLEIALADDSAAVVLEWSERWRARSLWPADVLPPADPELAESLTQLRHTVAALEQAVEGGGGGAARRLSEERLRLEAAVRQRSLGRAPQRRSSPPVPSLGDVRELLSTSDCAAAIELVVARGDLHAVVCTPRTCVVRRLGPVDELSRWRAAARFALSRLVTRTGSRASRLTAALLLERAVVAADRFLFRPLRVDLEGAFSSGGEELVIVPTGVLHSLPWAMLPSLRGRAVSLAPSLALVLDRYRAARSFPGRRDGATVLVAGPGVASAGAEVAALAHLYPAAQVLAGREATARRVACAMNGAATAHLVAHGRFRADNALFSALDMADGPLTVFDLEAIGEPPDLLVLSSCDAGRSDVQPGDELMGVAATMLSLGSRAIVASVAPVPDAGAPAVMTAFHEALLAGRSASSALAVAQSTFAVTTLEPGELADGSSAGMSALAAAGFVCLGAGAGRGGSTC